MKTSDPMPRQESAPRAGKNRPRLPDGNRPDHARRPPLNGKPRQSPHPLPRRGFTFIEIMMVSIIVVVIISIVSLLLIQFRRNYTKGEESSVVLQESGLMMAMLRTDFINAVAPPGSEKDCCSKAILVEGPNLMFQIFRDVEGTIETVKYSLLRDPTSPDRGSLVRIQGTGKPKLLVDRHVASLTWNMGTELFTGAASGTRRVWLDLDITLGGVGKPGIKPKLLRLNTKLFPTRLNRQLH